MSGMALPVIVGVGGINAAGRSSGYQSYQSMVRPMLSPEQQQANILAMGTLMGLTNPTLAEVQRGTMIRAIEASYFDTSATPWQASIELQGAGEELSFHINARRAPNPLPRNWRVLGADNDVLHIGVKGGVDCLVPAVRDFPVKTAAMLPGGFDPGALYASRNHPKGLQMALFAASDALGDCGLEWSLLQSQVAADQVSVYVGSAMGQLDYHGAGGMLSARLRGGRVTSKQCPLSLAEMPADFINAYVLGHVGRTGAALGACASFLYNLRMGVEDIQAGRAHIAFVGGADAQVLPEVMDGYAAMGALATPEGLAAIDGVPVDAANLRSICRPFGENCGFTMGESAQVIMLMSDELALRVGAQIYGSAPRVEVCSDGHKKSISGPGAGNYVTVAKILSQARAILGDRSLRHHGLVQAHGTSTPQNRVTEALILNRTAQAFGIESWPVAAIKTYVGHSLSAASADQLVASLGVWQYGVIPGIEHTPRIAEDVEQERLDFLLEHRRIDPAALDYAVLNSKGFGGNNASALILSPAKTHHIMRTRTDASAWANYLDKCAATAERSRSYDKLMASELQPTRYLFDHQVATDNDVTVTDSEVLIQGYGSISLHPSPTGYDCL